MRGGFNGGRWSLYRVEEGRQRNAMGRVDMGSAIAKKRSGPKKMKHNRGSHN